MTVNLLNMKPVDKEVITEYLDYIKTYYLKYLSSFTRL